jgi:hypothetical protein
VAGATVNGATTLGVVRGARGAQDERKKSARRKKSK